MSKEEDKNDENVNVETTRDVLLVMLMATAGWSECHLRQVLMLVVLTMF